jgi:MFS family permease
MSLPHLPALLLGISSGVGLRLLIVLISDDVPASQRGVALGMRMSANSAAATGAPSVVGQMIGALGQAITFPVCGLAAFGLIAAARYQSQK